MRRKFGKTNPKAVNDHYNMSHKPADRAHFGSERLGMEMEDQPNLPMQPKGYDTKPTPASMTDNPPMKPLSKGRNWNATRPKAPHMAK